MSGTGRKSAYRKSVTEEVLNSFPEPDLGAGERVARVVQSRGGNILQVRLGWGERNGMGGICRWGVLWWELSVGRLPVSSYLGQGRGCCGRLSTAPNHHPLTNPPTHPLP